MAEIIGQEIGENAENAEKTENTVDTEDIGNIETVELVEAVADIENTGKSARNLRKERIGVVVSNKMSKTIVVKVEESVKHSKYSKIMKRSVKFKAHDEKNECDVGDRVLIMETRPISKDKHFRLVRILEKVK